MAYPNNTRVLWFIKDFSTGTRVFGGMGRTKNDDGTFYIQSMLSLHKIPVACEDGILRLIDSEDVVLSTKWHFKHRNVKKGSRMLPNPF